MYAAGSKEATFTLLLGGARGDGYYAALTGDDNDRISSPRSRPRPFWRSPRRRENRRRQTMRILVVEDEKRLAGTLADLLHRQGYTVDVSNDGVSGLHNALSGIYDLVVLDVMLPGMDGFELLRRLRGEGKTTPVLMLTARSGVADRVQGLDCGADYYLTKPFESEELLACVRLLLRRAGGEMRVDDTLRFEDLALEPGTFQLSCGERTVRLSRREYDLMESLMRSGRQILTKEQLLVKVWGYDSDAEDNNVEVYISFLRRKLTHLHSRVKIRTQRMVGYCLEVEG